MAARIEDIVDLGSVWDGGNGVKFTVTAIETKESGTWITYNKEEHGSEYTCLVEAFLSRFRETPK